MKHRAFTLVEVLVVVAIIVILAALAVSAFNRANDNLSYGSGNCQSNLKQIGLGMIQYTQDYGEKYPILTTEQGWVGALQPYVKSTLLFQCPSEKGGGINNSTDYWFNRRLAGAQWKNIEDTTVTLMTGDGQASDDPNFSLSSLPPLWITKADSPVRRHTDEGNYLFADGHVKSLAPDKITLDKPTKGAPTFLVGP